MDCIVSVDAKLREAQYFSGKKSSDGACFSAGNFWSVVS